MKSYIIIALLALVSSSSFLRELQSPQTSSSVLQFPWSNETFDASGNWTLVNTNCTQPANGGLCTPIAQIAVMPMQRMLMLTITLIYPNNPSCGQNAGLTVDVPETAYNGIWIDNNATSPLNGSTGIFNFNNFTELLIQPDVNNPGNNCYQQWANNNSLVTNSSNLTALFEQWTGVWTPVAWFAAAPGQEAQLCCVPSGHMLIMEDLPTQTIAYAWTAPNCTACGAEAGTVLIGNVSVAGGGLEEQSSNGPLFAFMINATTFVAVEGLGGCAVQLQLTPANSTCAP